MVASAACLHLHVHGEVRRFGTVACLHLHVHGEVRCFGTVRCRIYFCLTWFKNYWQHSRFAEDVVKSLPTSFLWTTVYKPILNTMGKYWGTDRFGCHRLFKILLCKQKVSFDLWNFWLEADLLCFLFICNKNGTNLHKRFKIS